MKNFASYIIMTISIICICQNDVFANEHENGMCPDCFLAGKIMKYIERDSLNEEDNKTWYIPIFTFTCKGVENTELFKYLVSNDKIRVVFFEVEQSFTDGFKTGFTGNLYYSGIKEMYIPKLSFSRMKYSRCQDPIHIPHGKFSLENMTKDGFLMFINSKTNQALLRIAIHTESSSRDINDAQLADLKKFLDNNRHIKKIRKEE